MNISREAKEIMTLAAPPWSILTEPSLSFRFAHESSNVQLLSKRKCNPCRTRRQSNLAQIHSTDEAGKKHLLLPHFQPVSRQFTSGQQRIDGYSWCWELVLVNEEGQESKLTSQTDESFEISGKPGILVTFIGD